MTTSQQEIITIARSWLLTRWQHNQRVKGVGVDCINFLFAIAEEANIKIPQIPASYARTPSNDEIKEYLDSCFQQKSLDTDLEICDILLLEWQGKNTHVALVTDIKPDKIIHANQRLGRVVEHNFDGIWSRALKGIYRWEF